MIKAIIFDLGGVVLEPGGNTIETLAQIFKVDSDEMSKIYKPLAKQWVTGKLTVRKLVEDLKRKLNSSMSTRKIIDTWRKLHFEKVKVNKNILKLIDQLRLKYPVYLLTNTTQFHHQINSRKGIFSHFDQVFASHIIGKRKPDRGIYQYVVEKIGQKPKECFFTDDREEHVTAAKNFGIDAVLFESADRLKKDLVKRDIQLPG